MIKTAETYHVPVLLNESIEGLNLHTEGTYVDVTFGQEVDTVVKYSLDSKETAIYTALTKT